MADNMTTPVADGTSVASKDIGGIQYPRNLITDETGTDAFGAVTASPAANTLLGRLKAAVDALGALATISTSVDGVETLIGTTNTSLATIAGYLDGVEALLAAATPAGENFLGKTGTPADLFDVTLVLDTTIYADGDVLVTTQALTNLVRVNGGQASLQSILVIDEDDQGVAFDLVFLSTNVSLGTINVAPSITDTNARNILGIVPVLASDFKDLGGVRIATVYPPGLILEAASGSRDIYVAAISRGTGTYTASGLKLRLGLALA